MLIRSGSWRYHRIIILTNRFYYPALVEFHRRNSDHIFKCSAQIREGYNTSYSKLNARYIVLHSIHDCATQYSVRVLVGIAFRHCSNYIFILDLTHGCNELGKNICKTRRVTFTFWDLERLKLEFWASDAYTTKLDKYQNVSAFTKRQAIIETRAVPQGPLFTKR